MCQRLLSTHCSWNQAYPPRERQESVALHTLSQEDVVGHVALTRQSPLRAAQQLTTCQLCLSTPCTWNQAYRHNFLAGCIVNFMRTGVSDLSTRECHRNPLRTFLHTPRSPTSSGTPCRNRRHHTPAPRHAPRCLTMQPAFSWEATSTGISQSVARGKTS